MIIVPVAASIATAAKASPAPHILQSSRNVLSLRMSAMDHLIVATCRTKQIAFVPTISYNAVVANLVMRLVGIHSTVCRVPMLAMEEEIACGMMRKRKR